MKHLLFYALVILMITVVSISKNNNNDDITIDTYLISISNKPIATSENFHSDYIKLKSYTMTSIEKNNQEILQISMEIKEAQRIIEEERRRRIKNLKEQNTKLNNRLSTYKHNPNAWEGFKHNFSTNFKRMGLPFSELFPKTPKD